MSTWHILDWLSNAPFQDKEFKDFDDAEEYLTDYLGKNYDESREDYEIIEHRI